MRLASVAVLASVLLGACQHGPAPDQPAPVSTTTLGGVDLRQPILVLGTEPFWTVEITSAQLRYHGLERPEQTASNPGPVFQGKTAVFTGRTQQNNALVITLIDADCSDGMSDRLYPLTAKVEIGGETLDGCAISQIALDNWRP